MQIAIEKKKTTCIVISIVAVILIFAVVFGAVKFVQYYRTIVTVGKDNIVFSNSDGTTHLFRRSATQFDFYENDNNLENAIGFLSGIFNNKEIITPIKPKVNIKDLEVTIIFLNSDKEIIYTTTKFLGDQKKDIPVIISFGDIATLVAGISLSGGTYTLVVTGGTVSYFA